MEDENKLALEQFIFSKEFALIDENPRMERFYDLAIKALKKQIPLEVRHPIDMNCQENKLVTYCFSCGRNIKDMKYCPNCGQKLGWK